MGGGVSVDGVVVTKPATRVREGSALALVREPLPYVSRGGLKLRGALEAFGVDAAGVVALDVGASTGGFTDVLLRSGASRVYAIDVGYGQLAWTLRNDPRVEVMERTNIRNVEWLPEPIDLAVVDVSFISLRTVLPHVRSLLRPGGQAICLIKPQFEAGKGQVGKGGVVRDSSIWRRVLTDVLSFAATRGWSVAGLARSPIKGPKGNVEFLLHVSLSQEVDPIDVGSAIEDVLSGEDPEVVRRGCSGDRGPE